MNHIDGPHLIGPTTENLVARTTMGPGFLHPCLMGGDGHIYADDRGSRIFWNSVNVYQTTRNQITQPAISRCVTWSRTNGNVGVLTLTLLTWTKWLAPASASKWRMGFNSAFKGLIYLCHWSNICFPCSCIEVWCERIEAQIIPRATRITPQSTPIWSQ